MVVYLLEPGFGSATGKVDSQPDFVVDRVA
jgi:hypothetical protein